ncbi:helix-turn-helix domain-containing protein [Cryptosporangium arvum]|uniref:Putative transcriptional regulator n=1 Tax=Cryptosporangium arvum DSM 44712 TaxID=927661 RepID=A0A010ZPR7_9ACTN|nr:helix-turn-helix transcriptional regulator [Cryptosporangium arvum]EXG79207.1 putative transcriptional regulator [Cryptosporangium arvum DSM 44712]
MTRRPAVGELLRGWRERRRLTQLSLSLQADVSARHLSFIETGRSRPTSEMILRLCDELDVPLRERNALLLAGGYAPAFPDHGLDDPSLDAVRSALRQVLEGHEPHPAVVIDKNWNLVEANSGLALFADSVEPSLLEPPINVLRLSLHPGGMAPRVVNLGEWRAHLLTRLERQVAGTGDRAAAELLAELTAYPGGLDREAEPQPHDVVVPLRYRHQEHELSFLSMTAVFGTPLDVTVAELAIESFYPADAATAKFLRSL